jgi:hypothetical protein
MSETIRQNFELGADPSRGCAHARLLKDRPHVGAALSGLQRVLFRPRKELCRSLCGRAIDLIGTQPPTRYVIPIEVLRRPPIRETDFEAPAQGGGFVENDADAIGHPT